MSAISTKRVPNIGPTNAKILLVGESPGEEEEKQGEPFVGPAGSLLMQALQRKGVNREAVRLSNLSQYRPAGNKFELLFGSKELKDGVEEVKNEILSIRPNVVVALGAMPLYYLTGLSKKITPWRGSILPCIWDETIKVIPTFHPSFVLRDRSNYPTFDLDIQRISEDSLFKEFRLPEREYIIDPRGLDLEEWVEKLSSEKFLGADIETTKKEKHLLCIGFAPSPKLGICLVNHGDIQFQRAVERILLSSAQKIFHFGTFDAEVLESLKGYEINNYTFDTLVAQHILAPELPRGLDYLASIYTREPYYKSSGRGEIPSDNKEWGDKFDRQELYKYNAKDCCVTIEIALEMMKELGITDWNEMPHMPKTRDHELFEYEMSLIPVAQTLGRTGMPIDVEKRELFKNALLIRWNSLQTLVDLIMGQHVNVNSPKLKDLLYDKLGLPVRKHRDGKVTTDEAAVVATLTYILDYKSKLSRPDAVRDWEIKYTICQSIIAIRGIRKTLSSYILSRISDDDRIRSLYKYSNTETARGASEKYIDGTGVNSQTFPRGYVDVPEQLLEKISPNILSDLESDLQESQED